MSEITTPVRVSCLILCCWIWSTSYRTGTRTRLYAAEVDVDCDVVETNLTCWGDGTLTSDHVRQAGVYSKYTYAKIESGITAFGSGCFYRCSKLTNIDYPTTVSEFIGSCFQSCPFTTFHIRKTVLTMLAMNWNGCSYLTTFTVDANHPSGYTVSNGMLMKDGNLFCIGGGTGKGGTITFPPCEKILTNCMRWNECRAIVIHNNTLEVQNSAFYRSDLMTTITLGKKVETWHYTALSMCTSVTTFKLNGNTNFYFSSGKFGKKHATYGYAVSILWIKDNTKSLTIPVNVSSIGQSTLQSCSTLTNVTVASENTYFRAAASNKLLIDRVDRSTDDWLRLRFCVGGATAITVPSTVKILYSACFRGCKLLKTITLNKNVHTIYTDAIKECSNLTKINFTKCTVKNADGDPILATQSFQSCTSLTTIVDWPTSKFQIGMETFDGCGFTDLSLPNTCTQLIERSFANNKQLEKVTIPKSMTFIGPQAFYSCTKLKTVTFTAVSTLNTIESMAFASCPGLTTITLPYSLTRVIASCFATDTSLTSITMNYNNGTYRSDGIALYKNSGSNAYHTFVACPPGLTTITFQKETRVLGTHAFYGCNKLTDVVMNDKLTTIERSAFLQCDIIRFVRLSSSVNNIGTRAFDSCKKLEAVFYCSNNDNITYEGDPFPTNPDIYLFFDFPREADQCNFCGHKCEPILDHECNIPTQYFTKEACLLYLRFRKVLVCFLYGYLIL